MVWGLDMAKAGNHGQIIPRDKALLTRLYWDEGMTLTEIADRYGVDWTSVKKLFVRLEIPRRPQAALRKPWCIDCGVVRPRTLPHKLTRNGTGTRCHECLKKYKKKHVVRKDRNFAEVRAKRKALYARWYEQGAINPKGEAAWINKGRALLRTTKRLLASRLPEASSLQSEESAPAVTSPT